MNALKRWLIIVLLVLCGFFASDSEADTTQKSVDGVIPEIQVTDSPIVDFEFDWGRDGAYCPTCNFDDGNNRFVFTDRDHNMWIGHIDYDTGDFIPADGKGVLVDTRAAFATDFGNGPEWMVSVEGSQVVYTKYYPGLEENTFSASLAIAKMINGVWQAGIVEGGLKKQSPIATLDLDDTAPRINYLDYLRQNVYWRIADDPSSESLMQISDQTDGGSRRWVPGTSKVIFSGSSEPDDFGVVYNQVFTYDTDSDELEQLTFDPVPKMCAFMWQAPELENEYLFFTVADQTSIVIYRYQQSRNTAEMQWAVYNTIEMPEILPYVWSPEPFVYNGRSFILFQLSSNPTPSDMSIPTQIAMTGIDPLAPSFRMLTNDSNTRRVRMDPESFVTAQGPYIYYNRYVPSTDTQQVMNDGIWRVDTGLGPKNGDINRDNRIDLTDAIICLKLLAGLDISEWVGTTYPPSGADANGDKTIGMEDIVFIFRNILE